MDFSCPYCGESLKPDPANNEKLLCFECHKRFDADVLKRYYSTGSEQDETTIRIANTNDVPGHDSVRMASHAYNRDFGNEKRQDPMEHENETRSEERIGLPVVSLILGIISVLFFFVPIVGLVLGVIALCLGCIGVSKSRRHECGGYGLSIAGIVTGAIGIVTSIVITMMLTLLVIGIVSEDYPDYASNLVPYVQEMVPESLD